MSLETWKAEFYPTPARKVAEEDAVAHSLRKWRGLLTENLERHSCMKVYASIRDANDWYGGLLIADGSCALCHHYLKPPPACVKCPLCAILGRKCDDGNLSPYQIWSRTGDPKPMIAALEAIS